MMPWLCFALAQVLWWCHVFSDSLPQVLFLRPKSPNHSMSMCVHFVLGPVISKYLTRPRAWLDLDPALTVVNAIFISSTHPFAVLVFDVHHPWFSRHWSLGAGPFVTYSLPVVHQHEPCLTVTITIIINPIQFTAYTYTTGDMLHSTTKTYRPMTITHHS